ncbi:Rha family transcriptional regulator, partial [Yersinia ruckeri]
MNISTQAMIDSLEISKLVEKRHDNVKRTIETLHKKGIIQLPQIEVCGKINKLGLEQQTKTYLFEGEQGKRDSIIVVAQLSPEFTARLVDRWIELEQSVRTPELATASPTYINSDQVKSGLALLELSSRIVTVSNESLLQGLRNLQKAAGLPDLFPD